MSTLDDLLVTEPPTKEEEPTTGTAHVTYRFIVCGQERTFAAETTVSGSGAEAALHLISAGCEDAREWLRAQTPKAPTTVLVKRLFGQRVKVMATERVEPAAKPERGCVAATVEIDGVTHEYTGEFSTAGNPYRATGAALASAKTDLWDWAWAQKKSR